MLTMRYFNLMLRGKPVGCITTMCSHDGQKLWDEFCDEYPETYGEYFTSYDGEYDEEVEEVHGEDYERGLIMYAVECSKEDAYPLELDEEAIIRTLDDWQPCLTARIKTPEGGYDTWQEVYATWGDAMRDAEEKWAMLPDGFKETALTKDGRARFWLTAGRFG